MANSLKVTVVKLDGSAETYPITPKSMVAFERHFACGIGVMSNPSTVRMEHIYWLGWDAEKTNGKVIKPFDDWIDTISEVLVEEVKSSPLDDTASPAL